MTQRYCESCNSQTEFKNFSEGLYRTESGETVETCKQCGHLRTANQMNVIEPEMIHKPTQKKYKEMKE